MDGRCCSVVCVKQLQKTTQRRHQQHNNTTNNNTNNTNNTTTQPIHSLAHCSAGFSRYGANSNYTNRPELGWHQSARDECAGADDAPGGTRGCWCSRADWEDPLADGLSYRLFGNVPAEWVPGEQYVQDWVPKNWRVTYRLELELVNTYHISPKREPCTRYSPPGSWNETGAAPDGVCAPSMANGDAATPADPPYQTSVWSVGTLTNGSIAADQQIFVDDDYAPYMFDYLYEGVWTNNTAAAGSSGDVMVDMYFDDYGYANYARAYSGGLRGKCAREGQEGLPCDKLGRGEKLVATAGNWATTLVSMCVSLSFSQGSFALLDVAAYVNVCCLCFDVYHATKDSSTPTNPQTQQHTHTCTISNLAGHFLRDDSLTSVVKESNNITYNFLRSMKALRYVRLPTSLELDLAHHFVRNESLLSEPSAKLEERERERGGRVHCSEL